MQYLAACVTAKDEAPIIREWIAFHLASGIEHLIVIDHNSSDGMGEIVKAFPDQSKITYVREERTISQMDMYNNILKDHGDKFEWIAFIDADEFLFSADKRDIKASLKAFDAHGAVGVNWQIYGSSGHTATPQGLVVESYLRKAEEDFVLNRHIKSIVKPARTQCAMTSHMFKVDPETVNEQEKPYVFREPYGFFPEVPASVSKLRINHYHVRSKQDYEKKSKRGYFGDEEKLKAEEHKQSMWDQHDRNEVLDVSAVSFVSRMKDYL